MNLRDSILIRRNAICPEDLLDVMEYVRKAEMKESLVSDFEDENSAEVEWVVNKKVRDTQEVELSSTMRERLASIDDANLIAHVNPFFSVKVRDREPFQILHYGVGGHYIPHVDSESLFKDDEGLSVWEKTLDRDLSVVYFLNDDYAGGELKFPELDLIVKPEAGTLVCFPSDHHYIHGVTPVTRGDRFTLVSWMRVEGMPALDEINRQTMDAYHRAWPRQIEQPPRVMKGGPRAPRSSGA